LAGTGAVFIVAGLITLKNPPRKINYWYGYRTSSSKKSQARWDFAQQHSSRFMMKLGQVLIIISVPAAFVKIGAVPGSMVAVLIIVMSSIYMIVNTEKAIKNKFGGN
jgi:uncharacterized membrane protein